MNNELTIVFVHGAFADSSSWSATLSDLEEAGHTVLAVPNQLRNLSEDAAYVRSIVDTIHGPVLMVGHSYGGAVVGQMSGSAPNVVGLVFVAAYILDEGESIATVLDPDRFPGGLLGPDTTIARPFPSPSTPTGTDVDLWIRREAFAEVFAADVPDRRRAPMVLAQRPLALSALNGAATGEPGWRRLPSWALVAEADNAIPPAGQRWMAERAGSTIRTVASSHAVMVSHPKAVVALVEAAAAALETNPHGAPAPVPSPVSSSASGA